MAYQPESAFGGRKSNLVQEAGYSPEHEDIRRFRGYRRNPPQSHRDRGVANASDVVQYEGVVFSDGTVCVRWLTDYPSHAIWADFATFLKVHGHPEYGTVIEWLDGAGNEGGARSRGLELVKRSQSPTPTPFD